MIRVEILSHVGQNQCKMVAKAMTWDFQVLSRWPQHYNSSAMKPTSASGQMQLRGTEPGQCHMKTTSNVKTKQTFISEHIDTCQFPVTVSVGPEENSHVNSSSVQTILEKNCMQSQFFIKAKFSSFCLRFRLQYCSTVFVYQKTSVIRNIFTSHASLKKLLSYKFLKSW